MYDTYIFDLDGTLLDTLDDLTAATNEALAAFGCPIRKREEVKSFVGNGIRLLIERAVPGGASHPHFSDIFGEFKRFYAEHCCDATKPYDGVLEMLRRLNAAKKRVAVVSNKADFAVKGLCERYFGKLCGVAIGENEAAGIRKKPAPDSVFAAIEKLGGGKAVYIGDSEVDLATGKAAGMKTILVSWGFRGRKALEEDGADCIVDSVDEILEIMR